MQASTPAHGGSDGCVRDADKTVYEGGKGG